MQLIEASVIGYHMVLLVVSFGSSSRQANEGTHELIDD